jgi:hypothetical protein
MKKLALLLFVAVQAISVQAQQSITFKVAYKPNTTYTQTSDQATSSSVSYGEDMEPMEQDVSSKMTTTLKTGALSGGTMPITMIIEADKDTDVGAALPEGATIKGTVKQDGTPEFTSIEAPGMPEEQKQMMMGMMKSLAAQNLVSARTVKVGETFTIDTPLDMPVGPTTIKMNTKTTYKLTKVEGKKAYFDINAVIDMSSNVEGQDLKGTGTGVGTMVYDIDNTFYTQLNLKTNMKMNMDAGGMDMVIGTTQDSKVNVVIVPNK